MTNTSKIYEDYAVFVECKSLRGRSKAEYLRQVRKLAEHYPSRSLKQLTERQVFDYLIFRRDEQKLRPSTLNQAVVALRLFYQDFLKKDWQLWRQFEIRRDYPLPVILTREETRRLLAAIQSGRFKAVLTLIHHSDQGSQYASAHFTTALADLAIDQSMSRRANCYDNATLESFWATLKTECFNHRIPPSRAAARSMIFDYIETFYNPVRRHSSLGFLSPVAFENQFHIN